MLSCLDSQICSPAHDFPTTYAELFEMFSNEYTMMDGTSRTLRRETSSSLKRSVPSMKSLMPLKLLSPTLPQSDIWPSTGQDHRPTFGSFSTSQEISRVKGKANNPLGLRLSLLPPRASQRDTPIYNEPGSPLPGRAYYNSDDSCFNCSPPWSNYARRYAFNNFRHADAPGADNIDHDEVTEPSDTIDANDFRRRSYVSSAPRSSGFSFQCSGGTLFPSEAVWLSSPLPTSPKSQLRRRSTLKVSLESNLESWLSDTASEMGEDDLACATILSPKKARMVEVNSSRFSDEILPPRMSVKAPLSTTLPVGGRYSWASSNDSPPDTPTGEREFDDNRSTCRELLWIFPGKRFDLALNSPPMSPKVFPDPSAVSRFSFSVMSAGIETDEDPNMSSRWSFDSITSEPKSNVDIITDLEDIVTCFPSNILLPDTPCISEIRLSLNNCTPQHAPHNASYLSHDSRSTSSNDRKSVANFSRPRGTNNLSPSQSTPMVQTTAWRSSYQSSSSSIQPQLTLPPPDLVSLFRIFPNSSEYTRLALYAHIIAYIFITSVPTTSPQLDESAPRRRRDTPYWTTSLLPSRGAAILSHPRNSNSCTYSSESSVQTRILDLKSSLRKCIFCLMNNMDSSIFQSNDDDLGSGRGEPMLRAVEEVVRGSEKLAFAAF